MVECFDSDGVRFDHGQAGEADPPRFRRERGARAPCITQALAKYFQFIVLDNRGHGLSDKPHDQSKYGVEFCNDIVRLMDHLKIPKAHVVGYSMGSFITLKLTTLYPDRLLSSAPCGAGWERKNDPNDHREEIAKAIEDSGDFSPLFQAISPRKTAEWRGSSASTHSEHDERYLALARAVRSLSDLVVTEEALRSTLRSRHL